MKLHYLILFVLIPFVSLVSVQKTGKTDTPPKSKFVLTSHSKSAAPNSKNATSNTKVKKTPEPKTKSIAKSQKKSNPSPEKNPFFVQRTASLTIAEMDEEKYLLRVVGRKFAQGEALMLQLNLKNPNEGITKEHFTTEWNGKPVLMTKRESGFIGFVGIGPEEEIGNKSLVIKSQKLIFQKSEKSYEIPVEATNFQVVEKQVINLNKKYVDKPMSAETLAFIQECTQKKNEAFQSNTELQFLEGFSYPLKDIYITSSFYLRRDYNKKKGRPHGGVDFRGALGTPIKAVQDGTVVLSRPMYYEGNFVVLDHGNKIFSFYMHLSKMEKKVGDVVKKGDKIGEVGSTGMSTGPHLHLGAKIDGVLVDPLSLLALEKL